MTENIPVCLRNSTLGHRKIIDSIQKIGLALSVITGDAVYVGGKLQLCQGYVPEVTYYYFFQVLHFANLSNILIKLHDSIFFCIFAALYSTRARARNQRK